MKFKYARFVNSTAIILLIFTAFFLGYQLHSSHPMGMSQVWAAMLPANSDDLLSTPSSLKSMQLMQQAFSIVQAEYVDPVTNTDQLTYAAIRGMLQEIHDPYTRFMDPKEYKEFSDDNAGHFAGIGATLKVVEKPLVTTEKGAPPKDAVKCPVCGTTITDIKDFRITVVEPLPGTPAKLAGILPGDYIAKINDIPTMGMTVSDAAGKIRGPEGTKVALTIERSGQEKPLIITIIRANIEVPAVDAKIIEGNIGYLRLLSFNEKTVEQTRAALLDFNKANVHGVVLDLRSNPGGLLTECVKVASMLLPKKEKVIVFTKGRNRARHDENRVGDQLYTGPLVTLVNKGSASASEILSGALKDYQRSKIVGETTFGKALVQTVILLGDSDHRCAMPVTTARYYTPSGFDLNKKGITPTNIVELDKDVKELSEKDNQAVAALHILRDEMAKAK